MMRLYILCAMLLAMAQASAQVVYTPREGDLVFQAAGQSAMSGAISDATAWNDSVKFVHVAIVALHDDGSPYVIEASSAKGVTCTELDCFISSSPKIKGKPAVVVKRVCVDFPLAEAVERARGHLGEEYDWSYLPDNGKMYCSELVYYSYRKSDGSPLFAAKPMNFRDADGNMPVFWIELFDKLGEPVPEGVPGTNPNDMSKENVLTEVYRFF